MRLTALLVAAVIATPSALQAAAPERVEISQGEGSLRGLLYRPEGPGPFPAIVALHGCGGLSNPRAVPAPQYDDWGERLKAAGFAVLFPDSFGSRGLGSQCRVRFSTARPSREMVADAVAARRWLQNQSYVKADRVSLLGWSSGAIATLWAVRPQAAAKDDGPDFRSAVALYPGCRRLANTAWSARVPTLILVGGADDWSPASVCEQMVRGARGRSAKASIIVYPGAMHYFDRPNQPVQRRTGLAFSVDGSGNVTVGTHPRAREDVLKRVPEWLSR